MVWDYSEGGVTDPEALARLLNIDPTSYHRYDKLIAWAGSENQIDPDLIRAVILVESRFNASAASNRGARGLMQLMPATAQRLGVNDVTDPLENVLAGSRYLRMLLELFDHNVELALAAYDAGPKPVKDRGAVPDYPETKRYVAKVLAAYRILKNARA
jgi:soluble lytic murein transglycosylase-like protein